MYLCVYIFKGSQDRSRLESFVGTYIIPYVGSLLHADLQAPALVKEENCFALAVNYKKIAKLYIAFTWG